MNPFPVFSHYILIVFNRHSKNSVFIDIIRDDITRQSVGRKLSVLGMWDSSKTPKKVLRFPAQMVKSSSNEFEVQTPDGRITVLNVESATRETTQKNPFVKTLDLLSVRRNLVNDVY